MATMTSVMPLKRIAEEAIGDNSYKRISGQLKSYRDLFEPETLAAIDAAHDGVYGILAYDDVLDSPIAGYVAAGGLEHDTSERLLVLYPADGDAPRERSLADECEEIPDIRLGARANPWYEFVRSTFSNGPEPSLPGVLLLSRLAASIEPVFLSAAGLHSQADVRDVLQEAFRCASAAARASSSPEQFADKLCVELASSKVSGRYLRTESVSVAEFLIKLWHILIENRKDIMSVMKLF